MGKPSMADKKPETEGKAAGGPTAFLGLAFRAGLGACEKMQRSAIEIPLDILQHVGVAEDKIEELRTQAGQKIRELYELIDTAATKTGLVDTKPPAGGKPAQKG